MQSSLNYEKNADNALLELDFGAESSPFVLFVVDFAGVNEKEIGVEMN